MSRIDSEDFDSITIKQTVPETILYDQQLFIDVPKSITNKQVLTPLHLVCPFSIICNFGTSASATLHTTLGSSPGSDFCYIGLEEEKYIKANIEIRNL